LATFVRETAKSGAVALQSGLVKASRPQPKDNMRSMIIAAVVAAGAIGSAAAQPEVSVSIGINQPGVYGRINIGDYPRPALVLPQPVLIAPPQYAVERQPIYLYVPPAHQKDWRRYCGHYAACGQPVYFVQDQWVRDRYQEAHPGWNRGTPRVQPSPTSMATRVSTMPGTRMATAMEMAMATSKSAIDASASNREPGTLLER